MKIRLFKSVLVILQYDSDRVMLTEIITTNYCN